MASIASSSASPSLFRPHAPAHLRHHSSLRLLLFLPPFGCLAIRASGAGGRRVKSYAHDDENNPARLRRPLALSHSPEDGRDSPFDSCEIPPQGRSRRVKDEEWVDWEDLILQETVPLVGFVRMILHPGKYESGDRLNPEHEKTILERLLPYHPEFKKKIGCGIDYITIGFHPDYENSRCLFISRKDGVLEDFSYWKCIKGLIRKNYPLYADTFILRHFRR